MATIFLTNILQCFGAPHCPDAQIRNSNRRNKIKLAIPETQVAFKQAYTSFMAQKKVEIYL